MSKFFRSLPFYIIVAIALGVILGFIVPLWVARIFTTFKELFSRLLGFSIPLIILGLVTAAIGRMGKQAQRPLIITVALAYVFTLGSGLFAYFTGNAIYPLLLDSSESVTALPESVAVPTPYFTIEMPPIMGVMSALLLAIVLGLGMAKIDGDKLLQVADEFEAIVMRLISKVIVPLLPFYIASIFVEMTFTDRIAPIFMLFVKIIVFIFILHILLLLGQYIIAGLVTRRNPLKLLWRMMPAYVTALATQSSAATIPVTLKQTRSNGVSHEVSGFVIPLCATIHLSGSMLKIVSCALALMLMQHMPYDFSLFMGFIAMLAITMVAAPGVPGGAIMAAIAVLQSVLGFGPEQQVLMISLYITMDSFGTAANITGDGAIALIIERIGFRKKPLRIEARDDGNEEVFE